MAVGYLAEPGSKYGPCKRGCSHVDCMATRWMAATDCGLCSKPIGYNTGYFQHGEKGLEHSLCSYEAVEARQSG